MVDIREMRGPARIVAQGLDRFNRRHPWSHNDHFHGWILRHLPRGRSHALDVGCGRGELLAALGARFDDVDGIDRDPGMVAAATELCARHPNVTVRRLSFEQLTGSASYDVIAMVAVLHHLDLETALRRVSDLLVEEGRLLVVGLARPSSAADLGWDVASGVLNPIVGILKHPRGVSTGDAAPFPVADPNLTFDEIKSKTTSLLPGSRIRHRLFFRYTLEWTKPRASCRKRTPHDH